MGRSTASALNQIKDQEYVRQQREREERTNRLKEARRKYSKQKLKSKPREGSQAATSQSSNKNIEKVSVDPLGESYGIYVGQELGQI